MTNNENQYTIYIRSTKESIPVSKEEFDAYYHDINIYRIRQQRHGRCVCPASKRLTCDTAHGFCGRIEARCPSSDCLPPCSFLRA